MTYTETLHVPLRWWAQGTMLIATFWLAMVVTMPGIWAWSLTAVMLGALAAFYLIYGSARVRVSNGVLYAGKAHIGVEHLGQITALEPEESRLAAGRHADARAHLLLRAYAKRSVKVEITDPADRTPYWLISTRHPRALVGALTAARAETAPVSAAPVSEAPVSDAPGSLP